MPTFESEVENMGLADLEALNIQLSGERAEIRRKQLVVNAAIDRIHAQKRAEQAVADMSPADRAAMAQAIHAKGIEAPA